MERDFKYRIKTLEEFKQEYGEGWRAVRCSFAREMDYLLGADIDYDFYKECLRDDDTIADRDSFRISGKINGQSGSWNISGQMIKKVIIRPSYKPKKFVY